MTSVCLKTASSKIEQAMYKDGTVRTSVYLPMQTMQHEMGGGKGLTMNQNLPKKVCRDICKQQRL